MSTKHLFSQTAADGSDLNLVLKSLKGLIATNPSLSIVEKERVVFDPNHDPKHVSVISGGGSGHEPGHSGYVGPGFLAASVSGDVFASPNAKQVLKGIECARSDEGVIVVITNYTGDCLSFGLAVQKAQAAGLRVETLVVGDDVAVGRTKGGLVGRRGLAGTILINKILGSASTHSRSFSAVVALGRSLANNVVTMGASLDHCHVPGRKVDAVLEANEMELGMGIHNEPGYRRLSPIPSPKSLVDEMLANLLDQNDQERAYVKFEKSDQVVLFVNNLGGMSALEMGAVVDEVLTELESKHLISPTRVFSSAYMTSLNGPGFSLTLLNVTRSASATASSKDPTTTEEILKYLDAPTGVVGWSGGFHGSTNPKSRKNQVLQQSAQVQVQHKSEIKVDAEMERMIRKACESVIASEPNLTKWDTVMGDGDCGETTKRGATLIVNALDDGLAKEGDPIKVLATLCDIVELNMGGTLGALLAIFFTSLLGHLRDFASSSPASSFSTPGPWSQASSRALASLSTFTPAKIGDRTIMDVLIPSIESFSVSIRNGESTQTALEKTAEIAQRAADGTRKIKPKLGRATYVGAGQGDSDLPPDPGAWAVAKVWEGLSKGHGK